MKKALALVLLCAGSILGLELFLADEQVLYAIVSTNSSAATTNISNTPPTVEAVACSDSATGAADATMDLLGGTYDVVLCNATVNDINGGKDFNTTVPKGVFFENPANTIATCTQAAGGSNVDCYQNNSCAWLARKNETAQYVECRFRIWFNALNTTESAGDIWYGHINVTDLRGGLASANESIEMSDLLAVGVESLLQFGTKNPGSNDTTVGTGCGSAPYCRDNISNYGNVRFDIRVNGTAMTCYPTGGGGSIPAGYLHINLTDGALYSQSFALTATASNSAAALADFDLSPNATATTQTPTPTNRPTWWGFGSPQSVGGNCEGVVWFTAMVG